MRRKSNSPSKEAKTMKRFGSATWSGSLHDGKGAGRGFGRRLEPDGTLLAVKIAKQIDGPVKVIWSREKDIQHDVYRPYYHDRISAGLDEAGRPIAWHHRVCGSSVVARFVPPLFKNGLDFDAVEGAAEPPYAIPNILVEYVRAEPPSMTGHWMGQAFVEGEIPFPAVAQTVGFGLGRSKMLDLSMRVD
jgi:CO/xanthine dehydrogenase Mo-binding subunit